VSFVVVSFAVVSSAMVSPSSRPDAPAVTLPWR
jgi:hypothetical protein